MGWVAKTNRHVAQIVTKTAPPAPPGITYTNYAKRRPAIITGFATDTNARLRVRHIGETYGTAGVGIVRKTGTTGDATTGRYVSW